jgi:hypothetical protein
MGLRPTQGDEKRVHHRIVVSTGASRGPRQLRCWGGKRSGEICGSRPLVSPFSTERSRVDRLVFAYPATALNKSLKPALCHPERSQGICS